MKKLSKIFAVLLILAIAMVAFTTVANATAGDVANIFQKAEESNVDTGDMTTVAGNIVNIITWVGIIVAIIVLLVLGIKYMMGSAAEKAEYKKTMIPYLVGAVLIFGASAIVQAVVKMTTMTTGTGA
jgi:type IV secretory pathway VirB2 component (pilin)